ncbi:histidine kinase [Saccharopolyspora rhizosphaerae]|uniref:histidine kinase n=1 Tax=Saccharopolyspora rhizosphaerae TaxID=2492662 RepID=A0A426JRD9_9PSEU|nr:histidine kinase [Saccharopolyspora rhizosphaerae]RRO15718.1 histidine kinase [Saccharopolyspora rhizosphaerae]
MTRPLWRLLWNTPREAAFDICLVIGLHVFARVLSQFYPTDVPPGTYDWIGGLWFSDVVDAVLGVALLARRRYPVVLLWAIALLSVAQALLITFGPGPLMRINVSTDPWVPGITPWVIYAALVYDRGRRSLVWALIAVVTVVSLRVWAEPSGDAVVTGAAWTIFPAVLGLYAGARTRLVEALRERAERAERERELLAEQARAEERARLAAEMHDVVTHRVNLMVLQAGALGVISDDPAVHRAAEELRASGGEALAELRDLVGVLRRRDEEQQGPGAGPPSDVPDFRELIAQSEAVGMRVEFTMDGDPGQVTPAVGRTAYRVVQEGLTNAHKHAPGAEVHVRVLHSDDRVRVGVRNTAGSGPSSELSGSGGGVGLLGLQQRVELVGGTFRAGPTDGGGFEVEAMLPGYVPTEESADA